jgi:hypothetical protein
MICGTSQSDDIWLPVLAKIFCPSQHWLAQPVLLCLSLGAPCDFDSNANGLDRCQGIPDLTFTPALRHLHKTVVGCAAVISLIGDAPNLITIAPQSILRRKEN